MSGSIKKIIKKIPFVGSYVKKVQAEKKEEEQKQKLEKKRLELQKEQERIKVWLKSEKQNAPDKNSRKISVIVHHHTGEEQLQKLKENFKEAAAGLEFEVFTADIESKQNTSFAEFCNEAARKATGEYLFFLDESVQLASECLNAMLLAAEQNEKAGAVGARILYPESEKAISKFAAVKSCGIAFHKKNRNKTWYWQPYDLLAGEETLEVDLQPSVQKAVRVDVMLVLRERFLEVRGFDLAYQSIHVKKDEFSETDLCLKLSKAGYQNLLAPAALAFQSAEEKSKPDQAEKDRRLYNLYVYQGKWLDHYVCVHLVALEAYELQWDDVCSLMEQLVEGMLSVCSRFTEDNRSGYIVKSLTETVHAFTVGLHVKLLQMCREAAQCL